MRRRTYPTDRTSRRLGAALAWSRRQLRSATVQEPSVRAAEAGNGSLEVPPKPAGTLRLMTLNLAHGRLRGPHQALQRTPTLKRNLSDVASALREVAPDVVALQEADGPSAWSGNFDHVATLSDLSGLPDFFRGEHNRRSVGRFAVESGTALLARSALRQPKSQKFARTWRGCKGFVVATVRVPEWQEREIDVASVHLDFLAPSTRRRQMDHLIAALETRRRPLVLSGDLNSFLPGDREAIDDLCARLELETALPASAAETFPSHRPLRRVDWILASPELRFRSYRTLEHPLSDHRAVVADLGMPDEPDL